MIYVGIGVEGGPVEDLCGYWSTGRTSGGSMWVLEYREDQWRIYTFKAYNAGIFTVTRLLIPAWVVHYYVKYHLQTKPYAIVNLKPRLFPGDTVLETGEVIQPLEDTHSGHH
ncbi:NADH dehydrogenase [ubiquinone] 1 beta subcomplex subunit 6 isoform 2-T2 [Discoglossus pictus]